MEPRHAAVRSRLAGRPAVDPVLLPALLTIVVGVLLAIDDGGFGGESWYPAALFELALLALSATVAMREGQTLGRRVRAALVALVGLALWALASAMWSDVPALAWDGANRVLLYAIVLAIVALQRWPQRAFELALALVPASLGALALGVLVESAVTASPSSLFVESRLSAPTGYANASASLWLIGVWPALAVACGSRLPLPARAAAVGIACLLLETSLLSVSRGALGAATATAVVLVALSRDRHRVLAGLAVVVGCAALAAGPVLGVSDAVAEGDLAGALSRARAAMGWTCLLATALAAAAMLVARRRGPRAAAWPRLEPPRRSVQWGALVGVLVAVLAAVAIGGGGTWAHARWDDFTSSGYSEVGTGSQRITGSLGSGRYDFYRVALDAFAERPLAGIGYGNFQVPYLAHRRTDEAPRYTHSLPIGVLSQLGLVGAALLLAFLAAIGSATRRALARANERRTLVAGALAGFVVWFAHGLVDWLWEFSALGILAFALLGLAARGCAGASGPSSARRTPRRSLPRGSRAALGLAALTVAASFVALGLAARATRTALDEAPRDPAGAMLRLDQAARLDPLDAGPLLTRGVLALRIGDRTAAVDAFTRALDREPRNWFAELELGALYAATGHRAPALRALARAEQLNPRQQLVDTVRAAIRSGATVDPSDLERSLYESTRSRLRSVPGR
jgi:tetratricopeptide (TPR) repeat protein